MTAISGHVHVRQAHDSYDKARRVVQARARRQQDAHGDDWTATYSFHHDHVSDGYDVYRYCIKLKPDTPSRHHSGERCA